MIPDAIRTSDVLDPRRGPGTSPDARLDGLLLTPDTAPWRRPWGRLDHGSAGPFEPRMRPLTTVARWLGPVLADLPFPAGRWQLLAQADLNGADSHTRRVLTRLADGSYAGVSEVAEALAGVR